MRRAVSLGVLLLVGSFLVGKPTAGMAADPGVTRSEVVFGSWGPLTGPLAALGTASRDGFEVVIDEVNAAGGVHGRKIRLIAYDDAGSPQEALASVRRLIHQDRVFGLVIGSISGATLPVVPLINQAKIPFMAGTSSNYRLLEPHSPYVFRPNPNDLWQAYRIIDHMIEKGGSKRPAILYVSDDYGKGGYEVVAERAKSKHGVTLVAAEQYNKGDQDFSAQLLRIRQANPDSLLVWSFAPEAAIVVRQAKELGLSVTFYGAASTATPLFPQAAGRAGVGFVTEYPLGVLPESSALEILQYREQLQKKYPSGLPAGRPSLYDLLGGGAAKIVVKALERAGRDLTRQKFISALETLRDFDSGMLLPVTFTKEQHEGTTQVRMLRVNEKLEWEFIR